MTFDQFVVIAILTSIIVPGGLYLILVIRLVLRAWKDGSWWEEM